MATKKRTGLDDVVQRVQAALGLNSLKKAEFLVKVFESCLEETLIEHLDEDGYSIKLGRFGRFIVYHRPAVRRQIGFSGEIREIPPKRKVKFIALGKLRKNGATVLRLKTSRRLVQWLFFEK